MAGYRRVVDGLDALAVAPPVVCSLTRETPATPVMAACGHAFDQAALRRWLAAGRDRCPECGALLQDARPSRELASQIRARNARLRPNDVVRLDDVKVEKGRPLGRGSHGVVKRATFRGETVAVKQVPLDDDEAADAMQRELKALRALRHPNVVALVGAVTDVDEGLIWTVLEFAPHGSLHRMLHRGSPADLEACFGDSSALPGLGVAFWNVACDVGRPRGRANQVLSMRPRSRVERTRAARPQSRRSAPR